MIRRFAVLLGASVFAATACIPFNFGGTLGADRVWIDQDTGAWYREGDPDPIWTGPWEQDAYAVPADYDGDGLTDPAVYLDGVWTIEGIGTIEWPAPGPEVPYSSMSRAVPADYDGDGDDDLAFYNETDGTWYVYGEDPVAFGRPAHDVAPFMTDHWFSSETLHDLAVPGDYDGDGDDEMAVWQMDAGAWVIEGEPAPMDPGWPPGFPIPGNFTDAPGLELALWDPLARRMYVEGLEPFTPPQHRAYVPTALDHDADGYADLGFASQDRWLLVDGDEIIRPGGLMVGGTTFDVLRWNTLLLYFFADQCVDYLAELVRHGYSDLPPPECR